MKLEIYNIMNNGRAKVYKVRYQGFKIKHWYAAFFSPVVYFFLDARFYYTGQYQVQMLSKSRFLKYKLELNVGKVLVKINQFFDLYTWLFLKCFWLCSVWLISLH